MSSEEAERYIIRLLQGDEDALAPLTVFFHPALRRTLKGMGVAEDHIPDCIQATFLVLWQKIRQGGKVEYRSVPEFISYLKDLAKWQSRPARVARDREEQPEDREGEGWNPKAPPATSPDFAEKVSDLLSELLDASLVKSAAPEERDRALAEKIAFESFYVDGLTLPEVARRLTHYGVSVSAHHLNNWLSGGRILRKVVIYILSHRRDRICGAICDALDRANMTERDWETLGAGLRGGRPDREMTGKLVKAIQEDLHELRKKGA